MEITTAFLPTCVLFLLMIQGVSCDPCSSTMFEMDVSQHEWFAHYSPTFATGNRYIYKFSSTGDLTMLRSVSGSVEATYTCEDKSPLDPYVYLKLKKDSKQYCARVYIFDQVVLFMTKIEVEVGSVSTAFSCHNAMGDVAAANGEVMDVLPRTDFNFADSTKCFDTIPQREYHLEINNKNGNGQCGTTFNSLADMKTTGMEINSCVPESTYESPFYDMTLKCGAVVSSTIFGTSQDKGSILVWQYQDENDPQLTSFYCSFVYLNTSANQISISFDVTNENNPTCRSLRDHTIKGYERVNDMDNGTFVQMLLEANDCNPSECRHGGNCTQIDIKNFECQCKPGFTGKICETNIDDCEADSCMNGGTCVDGDNSFTCHCPTDYTGDRCQWHTCAMPALYAGQYQSVRNETAGTFTITSGSNRMDYSYGSVQYVLYCMQSNPMDWFPVLALDDSALCFHMNVPGNTSGSGILFYKTLSPPSPYLTKPDTATTFSPELESLCADATLDSDWQYVSISTTTPPQMGCPFVQGTYEEISISLNGANETECNGTAVISGDTMSMCGMEKKCIASYTATAFWGESNSNNGDILIWQNTATDYIYCARYKAEGNWIKMSTFSEEYTDGSMDKYPYGNVCKKSSTYESMGASYNYAKIVSNGCKVEPCENGGTCTSEFQAYTCACSEGWTGTRCEIDIDECASSPCMHGGTCHEWDGINFYNCSCEPGYSGDRCELYDECHVNPCLNGGTCSDTFTSPFSCRCAAGWTGRTCETDIDECASNPCQNMGTCHDYVDYFNCSCLSYTSGHLCQETINECLSEPCQHGGTCHDRHLGYACYCMPQWRGVHCEEFQNCYNHTCMNGGTCQDDLFFARCFCMKGWTGPTCEEVLTSCASDPSLCKNGGSCGGETCMCTSQYHGDYCQYEKKCNPNPCQNGGNCVEGMNNFACVCPDNLGLGVLDNVCQAIPTSPTKPAEEAGLDTVTIAIITIAAIIAAIVMGTIIFFAVKSAGAAGAGAGAGTMAQSVRPPATMYSTAYKGGQGPYTAF